MPYRVDSFASFFFFVAMESIYIGLFLTLAYGVALLFAPKALEKLDKKLSITVSMRKALKPFEVQIDISSLFIGNRKFIGAIFSALALFSVYFYVFKMDVKGFAAIWTNSVGGLLFMEIIFETLRVFFVLVFIFAGFMMVVFGFYPEKFDKLFKHSDNWLSTRKVMLPMEKNIYAEWPAVFKHNKLFGLVVIILSLYSVWQVKVISPEFYF